MRIEDKEFKTIFFIIFFNFLSFFDRYTYASLSSFVNRFFFISMIKV